MSGANVGVTVTASGNSCEWSANVSQTYSSGPSPVVSEAGSGTITISIPGNYTGADSSGFINVANQRIPFTIAETEQQFTDVPPSAYYFDAVNLLKQKNITSGCSATMFCPTGDVTRAEMAIFIVRSVYNGSDSFPYSTTPYFTDVTPTDFGFAWIQRMYELGITSGCGPQLFCPNGTVTRAEMAIFIIRMRYGAYTTFDYPSTAYFTDVPPSAFGFEWIQRMREDNITSGCTATTYCPDDPVIRGDMAIFLMRGAFNELLPASEPIINSASPSTLPVGGSASFSVSGVNTSFLQGSTTIVAVDNGAVTASDIQVYGPTSLSFTLTAAGNATVEPVSIYIQTGSNEAVLPNGVSVQ
jgi:hypothetical protein